MDCLNMMYIHLPRWVMIGRGLARVRSSSGSRGRGSPGIMIEIVPESGLRAPQIALSSSSTPQLDCCLC